MGAAAGAGVGSALARSPGAANAAARTVAVARRFMRLRFRLAAARPLRQSGPGERNLARDRRYMQA